MRYVFALLLILLAVPAYAETCFLKLATAVDLKVGPFVDQTDGFTAETGLTISQGDVLLSKNAGDYAQKNDVTACAHQTAAPGNYECELDTTDTDTLGILSIRIHESGALPVFTSCMVVSAAYYDFAFGSTALPVNVTTWLGTAAATPTVAGVPEVDVTHSGGVAGSHLEPMLVFGSVVKDATSVLLTVPIRASTTGAPLSGLVFNSAGLTAEYCRKDQGNAVCTAITLGTATRGTCTLSGFVEKDVTAGSYELCPPNAAFATGADTVTITLSGVTGMAPTIYSIDLTPIGLSAIATTLGTPVGASLAVDITNVTGAAISELSQGAPSATPTLYQAVMALYMALRNQTLTTSGTISYSNDAGTVVFKCSLADDGSTFTKSECVTGP